MSKLINAKINLSKVDKKKLFTGEKGIYLDLSIWINDKLDNYGNSISIQQRTGKDEPKIYIGEGKFYEKKPEQKAENNEGNYVKSGKTVLDAASDTVKYQNDINDNERNLPF